MLPLATFLYVANWFQDHLFKVRRGELPSTYLNTYNEKRRTRRGFWQLRCHEFGWMQTYDVVCRDICEYMLKTYNVLATFPRVPTRMQLTCLHCHCARLFPFSVCHWSSAISINCIFAKLNLILLSTYADWTTLLS